MKKIFLAFLLSIMCWTTVSAQSAITLLPFASLDKHLQENEGGWGKHRVELSKLFQRERAQMGAQFETELWKYIADDQRKHYWTALFLDSDAYLHGSAPMPELALKIRRKALEIPPKKSSLSSASTKSGELDSEKPNASYILRRISLLIFISVAAEKSGDKSLSSAMKKEAEALLSANQGLRTYLPVLSKYNRCVYASINTSAPEKCQPDSAIEIEEGVTPNGVVKGKVLKLPKPGYPLKAAALGVTGTVIVRVVIDEQGNVVEAQAIEGHPEFFKASEKAAMKAKFSPTTLYGQPVKVTGTLSFNFQK